ncbi:MAG: hypothetical protein K0R39_4406 [Symbiobacteriaceae bacterium]|nr:hypothetical protein [Symbiobacteriaceae bacterium]
MTGSTCSVAPPIDPDFVYVTINVPAGNITLMQDRNGNIYVTPSAGAGIVPYSVSGGMGWVVADTGSSLEDTLSGAGYGGCGTGLGVMACVSQSGNGSIMVSIGFETAVFDVSQSGGYTVLIRKDSKE